ncbi:DEAD/DEAH box helicase [Candidatus Woesearchaeota archaeon]|nr:DEAD/DEAH box helicase [Candidatus Woesearchaeota archaeon]
MNTKEVTLEVESVKHNVNTTDVKEKKKMNMKEIKLQPELEKAVMDLGFSEFTEIQEKCIPLLQAGKDVIGQSHTGSGKTAAFGFPMLEKITHGQGIQGLILVPTRELCNQVAKELVKFSKYKRTNVVEVYGGVSINPQIWNLPKADVVVATPGRILDHLQRGTINLSKVKILVLDEADKMFEMGFIDDIKRIISQVPKERQTMLFSATMPRAIVEIVRYYMKDPTKVKMQEYVDKSKLIQHYYDVDRNDKFSLLVHLLRANTKGLTIIFCATKRMVDTVGRNLTKYGIKAQALHGGLSQNQRTRVMELFHGHKLDVLVASDVAARGLDIKNVGLIVNFDIPRTSLDYVHRIGRTARAGAEGQVISLLSNMDHDNFRNVLQDRSLLIQKMTLPEFERLAFSKGEMRGGFGDRQRFGGGRGGFGGNRPRFGGSSGGQSRFGGGRPRFGGGRSHGGGFGGRSSGPRFRDEGSSDRPRFQSHGNSEGRENRYEGRSSFGRDRESSSSDRENRFSRNDRRDHRHNQSFRRNSHRGDSFRDN